MVNVITPETLEDRMEQVIRELIELSKGVGVDTSDIESILFDARQERMKEGINLIASENRMSPKAKLMYWLATLAGLDGRYAEGHPGKRYYPGTKASDLLEPIATKELADLLGAKYVDVRPISGNNANMAVFLRLLEAGDTVMAYTIHKGGHISHADVGSLGRRLKVRGKNLKDQLIPIPVTADGYHMDVEETKKLIERHKPKLIVVGKSLFLFPESVSEIADVCNQSGTIIYYDAAHVQGLIAGGQFQHPLKEGAHLAGASTHKTFPGPQGGILYSNSPIETDYILAVDRGVMPGTTSSHHLHRIAPLIVTIREFRGHPEYADQTVKNARALAESLARYGLEPDAKEYGYTMSHQVALNVRRITGENGKTVEGWLENNGIYANSNALPIDTSVFDTSGIRMGTPEMTRRGMMEEQMDRIAWLMKRVILDRVNVKQEAKDLAMKFPAMQYW